MAYRDEAADLLEAPTSEGILRMELAPRSIKLTVARRSIHITDKLVTISEHLNRRHPKQTQLERTGPLVAARDVPHDDIGLWLEMPGGMRRIFGVEPVSLLEPEGLTALAALDRLAQRLKLEVEPYSGDIRRAIEIGRAHALDKVLLADHGDYYVVYARRLFRDRARLTCRIDRDGKVTVYEGRRNEIRYEAMVKSQFGVTVRGDFIRFAAPDGADLARFAIPWITREDRLELARRIGQLVDTPERAVAVFGLDRDIEAGDLAAREATRPRKPRRRWRGWR